MSKQLKIGVLSLSFFIVLLVVLGGLGVHASSNDGAYRQLGVYSEVLSRIRTEYVEEPNFPAVTSGALHGLLESLDADSSYLNPDEYKFYKTHQNDGRSNIGATVSKRFGYAAVVSIIPGGPADKAGIQPGDIIEAMEGKSTHEMSLAAIEEEMAGKQGSTINFAVVRPGKAEPQKITVTRDNIVIPGTTDKIVEDGIADIEPIALTKGKAQEIAGKIRDEQKKGAKKLILDLRNVSDGDPVEAVAVANLFLNHGVIAYLQGQKYPKQTFTADPQKAITNLPLVVLVNRGTAGPGEIVAGAILDNNRGDVVGDKTFGSGSVQKVIEIPADGSALILSIAKYYTPSGKVIEDPDPLHAGVTPNIVVASSNDDALPDDEDSTTPASEEKPKQQRDDEQFRRAVQVLKARG